MYQNVDYWYSTESGKHIPVVNSNNSFSYNDILKTEKNREGLKHEELSIYSRNGKLLKEIKGEDNHVNAIDYRKLMNNSIVTHNHPMGDTFSTDDIKEFINSNIYEIRASTNDKTYSLKKGNENPDIKILEAFSKMDSNSWNYANNKMMEKIKNNELNYNIQENPYQYNLDRQKIKGEFKNNWLIENAKNYGYIYNEEKRK